MSARTAVRPAERSRALNGSRAAKRHEKGSIPACSRLSSRSRASIHPRTVIDKSRYSGFAEAALPAHLHQRGADGLIVTGSETDVCVLATVLGAVDLGYPVILVRDAVCSSSDEGHDALMKIYNRRYSEQIEAADAETIVARWA